MQPQDFNPNFSKLKGEIIQDSRFFASNIFHELSSPKPLKITVGHFKFFRKFADIFASQGAPTVSPTPVAYLPPLSTTLAAKCCHQFC
jgi:hypothetical protein